jgi:hypothetical protein
MHATNMRKRLGNLGRSPRRAPDPALGPTLRAAIASGPLTVPQVAVLVGVSDRSIQYYEAGERCPSAVVAGRLQAELGIAIPMPPIHPSELSRGSLNRIRRAQRKAQQDRDAAFIAANPPAPPAYEGPRFVSGW